MYATLASWQQDGSVSRRPLSETSVWPECDQVIRGAGKATHNHCVQPALPCAAPALQRTYIDCASKDYVSSSSTFQYK